MTTPVHLPRTIVNQMLRHAQQSPSHEVCGLIGAKDGIAAHCYVVANIASSPRRLFAMDPARQIAAMRTMRELGEELFAIYHSHPASPPFPSRVDMQQANYSEALYLIISLQTQGVLEIRGFRLNGDVVIEIPLDITE